MKYEQLSARDEFPVVDLLSKKSRDILNTLFGTDHKPTQRRQVLKVRKELKEEINDEIDKLMRQKPAGGGYAI